MSDIRDFLGKSGFQRATRTRYYALAQFIDALLYGMSPLSEWPGASKALAHDDKLVCGKKIYVSGVDPHIKMDGRDKDYYETVKVLREIGKLLERLAALEATE
jgi:hypothetical protein